MQCLHCNHAWRFEERAGTHRRYCSLACQAFFYALGEKIEQQYNDVMVVREPSAEHRPVEKGGKVDDIAANNRLKSAVTRHWRAIFLEFVDYFDNFLVPELHTAFGADFQPDHAVQPRAVELQKKQLAQRELLAFARDSLPPDSPVRALLIERETVYGQLRKELYITGQDDVSAERREAMRSGLQRLKPLYDRLDAALEAHDASFAERRSAQLLEMQYVDYTAVLLSSKAMRTQMKKIFDDLKALHDKLAGPDLSAEDRAALVQKLKNHLSLAYQFHDYHESLWEAQKAGVKDASKAAAQAQTLHTELLKVFDEPPVGAGELSDAVKKTRRQLTDLVRKYPAPEKESESTEGKGKARDKDKRGKLGREGKAKKSTRPPPKGDESGESMQVEPPRQNNNNNNTALRETAEPPPVSAYTQQELRERAAQVAAWNDALYPGQPVPFEQMTARQKILSNMFSFYQVMLEEKTGDRQNY